MSSFSKLVLSKRNANATRRSKSRSHTPPPSIHGLESTLFSSRPDSVSAGPTSRSATLQPTEDSETTILDAYYHCGMLDNTSSVTLQDEFPWHEVGVNKYTQKIPSTIVPALLQAVSSVSPSRSSVNHDSNPEDLPLYSAAQKGKWKAREDEDVVGNDDPEYLEFEFLGMENSAEDWAAHSRPILQEYADRQTSLPLGRRLEVSIDKPSQFILGALHLLVNRDQPGCSDRSRMLGPQLIENFVDIERWAKEYFRSRYATQFVDSDVSILLTIVMNNFYEGQVQLIDRLVEFALENMHVCGRRTLCVEDFAFGFDFRMSQDLPFYVETRSRVREPSPVRAVEAHSTVEPVITSSGRQVKPTRRAQESVKQAQTSQSGRKGKGKKTRPVKDKQAQSDSIPATSQSGTSPSQPSSDDKAQEASPEPSKATPAHTKHRPIRPSNLKLPPIMPEPSPGTTQRCKGADNGVHLKLSEPAEVDVVSGSNRSDLARRSSSRLKLKIPPMAFEGPTESYSGSASGGQDRMPANAPPIEERATRRSERIRPGGPRKLGSDCSRSGGAKGASPPDEAPAAMSVDNAANVQPTEPPLATGDAAPSAVDTSKRTTNSTSAAKSKSLEGASSTGPHDTVDKTGAPVQKPDPGHPQRKKRKLDDCDD